MAKLEFDINLSMKKTSTTAFTLVEILIVVLLVSILSSIAWAGYRSAMNSAKKAACIVQLRQIGQILQLYLSDNNGFFPPYVEHLANGDKRWYFGYERKGGASEGERELDCSAGSLTRYISDDSSLSLCPAFPKDSVLRKEKFKDAFWGYGYNWELGGKFLGSPLKRVTDFRKTARVLLFADCAQINTFQAPASSSNPMIEEFYLLDPAYKTFHFRHGGSVNAYFLDGHMESLQASSIDKRLEDQNIGNIDWSNIEH